MDVPFIFDDINSIQRNTNVRFEDYRNFSLNLYLQTRSLLYATFAFNNWVGSQNVLGYHIVNLSLHILNGLLVFAAGVKVFRKAVIDPGVVRTYSLLATAFFLVHPIQTESVTYISSRSELLSTFFYMLGFVFFTILPENRIGFLASLLVTVFLAVGLRQGYRIANQMAVLPGLRDPCGVEFLLSTGQSARRAWDARNYRSKSTPLELSPHPATGHLTVHSACCIANRLESGLRLASLSIHARTGGVSAVFANSRVALRSI